MIGEYPVFVATHISNEEYILVQEMVKRGRYPSKSYLLRIALEKLLDQHKRENEVSVNEQIQ
jgi:Arc/MetJ-type ribon-helix-helix transcriptional regulator